MLPRLTSKPALLLPLLLACLSLGGILSCQDDDPIDEKEESITSLNILFTGPSGPASFDYQDLDGPGGSPFSKVSSPLAANSTYEFKLTLYTGASYPTLDDFTDEIRAKGEEHQLFFQPSGVDLAIEYGDKDIKDRPIGLTGVLKTGAAGSGGLRVTLRRNLIKAAEGVAAGRIANAGGETAIDLSFDVLIE